MIKEPPTNIVTLNGNEITLIKVGINNQLNQRQKALLEMMYHCLDNKKPFNWDAMVSFYSKNVKKQYEKYEYDYDFTPGGRFRKINEGYVKYDIVKEYKANSHVWSYYIRQVIRQWFANNIGSMVLKGSILALPIIELD
jgi:hypothetical protein